ncbi:unnamed protein product [Brassica rapa subsp. narinosa]
MWFLLNPPGKATIHVANVYSLMQHMRLNSTSSMRPVLGDNHNPDDDIPGATYVFCKSSEGMKLIGSYWPCSHQLASQNDKNFSSFRDYDPIYSQVLIYLLCFQIMRTINSYFALIQDFCFAYSLLLVSLLTENNSVLQT